MRKTDATDAFQEITGAPLPDGYSLIRQLGVGSISRVFLVRNTALKRLVALNVLRNALAAAHEHRVIHRAVEPTNVLPGRDGNGVYQTDFGVADRCRASCIAGKCRDGNHNFWRNRRRRQ